MDLGAVSGDGFGVTLKVTVRRRGRHGFRSHSWKRISAEIHTLATG